nr:protein,Leu,Ile,Val binding [Escherichia coli]
EDIKVAVVGAMSGPVAQYGDQDFTGAEQAVADINAKGGIKGNKLQIVKYDDAITPAATAPELTARGYQLILRTTGLDSDQGPGQILRQARAAGLKTQFMGPLTWDEKGDLKGFEFGVFDWHANGTATADKGPEGVANVSLSNIAGESAEGLLVTKPKNYD